jgi:hypothetical protein
VWHHRIPLVFLAFTRLRGCIAAAAAEHFFAEGVDSVDSLSSFFPSEVFGDASKTSSMCSFGSVDSSVGMTRTARRAEFRVSRPREQRTRTALALEVPNCQRTYFFSLLRVFEALGARRFPISETAVRLKGARSMF